MKITVIGTINKDLILPFKGATIASFGGIFYSVSILSRLLNKDDEIIPVSFVGEDIYDSVTAVFGKMGNVRTEGLIPLPQKNHKVILEYRAPEERQEKALFNFPPLAWEHVENFIDSDFVIVNMITGWDLAPKAFLEISRRKKNQLYLDIHFLVMDIDEIGRRYPRQSPDLSAWLKGARFVQLNEREFRIIAGKEIKEGDFFQQYMVPDQVLLITMGEKGAMVVYRKMNLTRHQIVNGFKIPQVVDTTGCGDAFGAGFVAKYIQTGDLVKSARFANLTGAANASLEGTNEMNRLKEMMELIEKSGK